VSKYVEWKSVSRNKKEEKNKKKKGNGCSSSSKNTSFFSLILYTTRGDLFARIGYQVHFFFHLSGTLLYERPYLRARCISIIGLPLVLFRRVETQASQNAKDFRNENTKLLLYILRKFCLIANHDPFAWDRDKCNAPSERCSLFNGNQSFRNSTVPRVYIENTELARYDRNIKKRAAVIVGSNSRWKRILIRTWFGFDLIYNPVWYFTLLTYALQTNLGWSPRTCLYYNSGIINNRIYQWDQINIYHILAPLSKA